MSIFQDIIDQDYCLNIRKSARAITKSYDACLEPSGIRSTQFSVLLALASSKCKTLTEIAETLVMDRTTLTRNLKPLEKRGFVKVIQLKGDRRTKECIVTEKGQEVIDSAVPLWEKAQDDLDETIGSIRVSSDSELRNYFLDMLKVSHCFI